jgi:hypothetical protein
MEHRWGHRVDLQIPMLAELGAHSPVRAHTVNVSLSGAFLRTAIVAVRPVPCFVEFELAGIQPNERHRILAHVVRQTQDGVGIEWAEFAPRVVRLLFDWSTSHARSRSGSPHSA